MLRHAVPMDYMKGKQMNFNIIGTIVILALVLILVIAGVIIGISIRNKVRKFSREVFGTDSIVQGFQQQEVEYASKPKSVSGATSLYLPQIMRDFPQFHSEEMKERAESVLLSFLQGITEENCNILSEGTRELKDALEMKIRANRNEGSHERYERIKIHRTEINKYRKEKGRCSVVYQSAVGCIHYVEKDGRVIRGRKEMQTQHRYNVEVCYIQDRDLAEESNDSGYALNCPNCGGPLTSLGATTCPYCDSPVVGFNIHTWQFTGVDAVK